MFKKSPKLNKPLTLLFLTTFLLISEFASAQTCSGCTQTYNSGDITVNNNQVVCIPTGVTFNGNLTIRKGGTVCVSPGATFNPNVNELKGTIINRGNMSFNIYSAHNGTVINYNNFTTSGFQGFAGTIENHGTFNINGYYSLAADAYLNNIGTVNFNSNGAIYASFDNSGYANFMASVEIDGLITNYKEMTFNKQANIYSKTYLTNDGNLRFLNVNSAINFQGPMLTNNGELTLSGSNGSLGLNSSVSQIHNNGKIIASGVVSHNAVGAKIVNNCTIKSAKYIVGNGISENNGLIQTTDSNQSFQINGGPSYFINGEYGFVSGSDFVNSGIVSGYGKFYFTGNTQNSGSFKGSSATNPIQFYDTTLASGAAIMDNVFANNPWNMPSNTLRPSSMTPSTLESFDCGIIPKTTAGYPPTTEDLSFDSSAPGVVNIPLTGHAFPHPNVEGKEFKLMYESIRLFEYGNPDNPTNNSTSLYIENKGTFTVNPETGEITFTPDSGFTNGTVIAEYKISNRWNGAPPVHPGSRKKITVTFSQPPCYKDPNTDPTPADSYTNSGVTSLSRPSQNWPGNIPNGFLALESKDKGFVITRVLNQNAITDPKEGMLIYDIQAGCVKLHNGEDWKCIQRKCN